MTDERGPVITKGGRKMLYLHPTEIDLLLAGKKDSAHFLKKSDYVLGTRLGGHLGITVVDIVYRDHAPWLERGKTYTVSAGFRKQHVARVRVYEIEKQLLWRGFAYNKHHARREGWDGGDDLSPDEQFARWWNAVYPEPGLRFEDAPPVWRVFFTVVELLVPQKSG